MARPRKKGLDYIPLDVHFFDDRRIRQLNIKYGGGKPSFVYLKIITEIFQNSFYITIDDDLITFLAYDSKIKKSTFKNILDDLVKYNFFDENLYSENVLTSQEIQKQFFSVKNSSKSTIEITEKESHFLLININEFKNLKVVFPEKTEDFSGFSENISEETPEFSENNSKKTPEKKQLNETKFSKNVGGNSLNKRKENKRKEKGEENKRENSGKTPPLSQNEISFFKKIIEKFPDYLKPKNEKEWEKAFFELRENLSVDEIDKIITFALKDKFWSQNIVSLTSLLKKSKSDGIEHWKKIKAQIDSLNHSNIQQNPQSVSTEVQVI